METVTVQLSKVPNSPAVLSFDKEVGTRSVDREVLFRSPVLTHTLSLDIDGAQQTSTVCAPSGFVGAWLDYINASEPDQDSSKGIQQGTDSLLLSLRAADFFADEKTIAKVCTEVCNRLFSEAPSRKRRREPSVSEDGSDTEDESKRADSTEPEQQMPTLHLNEYGREMLTQIPQHLAGTVIKALEGGVGPALAALPPALHHLAVSAHLPCVSSEKALRLDGNTFMWEPSPAILEALLVAVSSTPLNTITVCCCCLEMLSVNKGVVQAFSGVLRASTGLTCLSLGGAFCTGSIVSAITDVFPALPELRSLSLTPDSLGIKRSQILLTCLAVHGGQLTELSLHGLKSSSEHNVNPLSPITTESGASCSTSPSCLALPSTPSIHATHTPKPERVQVKRLCPLLKANKDQQLAATQDAQPEAARDISAQCNEVSATQRCTTALAATLLRLTRLESLTLTGETLTGPSLRDIEAFLKESPRHSSGNALQFLPELTHLNFRCSELSNIGSRALAPVLRRLTSLQELLFLWNSMEVSTAETLACAISGLPKLTMVNLRQSNLGECGADAISQSWGALTGLRYLNLNTCRLTAAATAALVPVLANFTLLEYLDVSGDPLVGPVCADTCGARALVDALQDISTLKHLYLRNVGLTCDAAKTLAPCIARQPGLQSLCLQCNVQLGSTGIVELSRRFEALSCLRTLRLDCTEVNATAARAFGAALQRLTALTVLNLIGFRLHTTDTLAQVFFGASFAKLENLESLDLSGTNFTGPAAQGLSRSLRSMCKLLEIHLQYNPMGDIGAVALAPALAKLPLLKEVNMIGAQLTEKGAKEIVKELGGHPTLEMCLLDVNDVGDIEDQPHWVSTQTDEASKEVCLREYWRRAMNPM